MDEDAISNPGYPWRRYFARSVDYGVYYLIWIFLLNVVFRGYPVRNKLVLYLIEYIVFAEMIFIEPLLLSRFGTTLGKWIFGLSLSDAEGCRLTYKAGLSRTWCVFAKGYGYNIPIYNIIRMYKSYKVCKDEDWLLWNEDYKYSVRDTKLYRSFVFIGVYAIIIAIGTVINLNAEIPKNRGEISAAEFAENYNGFMDYVGFDNSMDLNADGTWEKDPNTIELSPSLTPKFRIDEVNGIVTGVSFEIESEEIWISSPSLYMLAAFMSYVAVQPEMNCIKLRSDGVLKNFKNDFQSFEFTSARVKVSCNVDYYGYTPASNFLISSEGEKRYFHLEFSMMRE